jgi:hypothetical protein
MNLYSDNELLELNLKILGGHDDIERKKEAVVAVKTYVEAGTIVGKIW